jgi:hypothetical protein
MERNRKVPGRPGAGEPPWNLPVSLHVSLGGNYERLNDNFPTTDVSRRKLWELESGFAETELLYSHYQLHS